MSAASAGAAPPPAAMPTAVAPTAGEAAALPPVPALPMPQEPDHVGSFYAKCLAAYDARNHKGTSGRATACDTHRVYAITYSEQSEILVMIVGLDLAGTINTVISD